MENPAITAISQTKARNRVRNKRNVSLDRPKANKKLALAAAALMLSGAILVAPIYYFKYRNAQAVKNTNFAPVQTQAVAVKPTTHYGNPVTLLIPSLNMR